MKRHIAILLTISIILLLPQTNVGTPPISPNVTESPPEKIIFREETYYREPSISTDYVGHVPISINGDVDLADQAFLQGWDLGGSRDGTKDLPFVMSGYEISGNSGQYLIRIQSTTLYLVIYDMNLLGGNRGISLEWASNVEMELVQAHNQEEYGFYLGGSGTGNNSIVSCTVTNTTGSTANFGDGIVVQFMHNISIHNSVIRGVEQSGIHFNNIVNGSISSNTISDNGNVGIELDTGTTNLEIINNNISNSEYGIQSGVKNYIAHNLIFNQSVRAITVGSKSVYFDNEVVGSDYGFYILGAYNAEIRSNWIHDNIFAGIWTSNPSSDNIISDNVMQNNPYGLYLYRSSNNSVLNNVLLNSSFILKGYLPEHYDQWEFRNNTINDTPIEYRKDFEGEISGFNSGMLIIVNSQNVDIHDSTFSSLNQSLLVANSDTIRIYDNIIENCDTGLELVFSNNTAITRNTFQDNRNTGMIITSGNNISMSHNIIQRNNPSQSSLSDRGGLYAYDLVNISILHNDILDNGYSGMRGIELDYAEIGFNTLIRNFVNFNLEQISNVNIFQNHILNSTHLGIFVLGQYNTITGNDIQNSGDYGMYIYASSHTNITWNSFVNNNFSTSQVLENLGTNILFENNFYDDWIGSGSYTMDGAGLQDLDPVATPISMSDPVITNPVADAALIESVTISWTAVQDSYGHSSTYQIYVSSDGGYFWHQLATDLSETSYLWRTRFSESSDSYLIRIRAISEVGIIADGYSEVFRVVNPSHQLSTPLITSPNLSDELGGLIQITWSPAIDNYHQSVMYSLSYAVHESQWIILAQHLTQNLFLWNVTDLDPGTGYQIRIDAMSDGIFGRLDTSVTSQEFTISSSVDTTGVDTVTQTVVVTVTTIDEVTETSTTTVFTSTSEPTDTQDNATESGLPVIFPIMVVPIMMAYRRYFKRQQTLVN